MMDSSTKKMVIRLIEETSTRRVTWAVGEPPRSLTQGTDDVFPLYFEGLFKGKMLCIYQSKTKHYIDDRDYYWNESLVIGIVDDQGRVVWEYEGNEPELHELFNDVRRSAADVDQFLNYFR